MVFLQRYALAYLDTGFIRYKCFFNILLNFWYFHVFLLGWGDESGFDIFLEVYVIFILNLIQFPYWFIITLKMFV